MNTHPKQLLLSPLPLNASAILLALFLGTEPAGAAPSLSRIPGPDQNLRLDAPITSWDEAIPLGNGLLGGLLWGTGSTLRLSLDRGDLWDERPAVEAEWWKKRTWARGGDWDEPYNGVTPTKLPAGRIEISLADGQRIREFELNLANAEGRVHLANGSKISAFYSATERVVLLRIPGPAPASIRLTPSGANSERGDAGPSSGGAVSRLGYPPAVLGEDAHARWFVQEAALGLRYCALATTRRLPDATLLAVTVTSSADAPDVLALARARCRDALERGYEAMLEPHAEWWRNFWNQSSLVVPDARILRYYYFARYLYGAGSRRGAPPMPLQGVWTADNGGLPPWKGDYHNDLNTQMTYIAYQAAGHFDEGATYLEFLRSLTPAFRAFARDFYGTPGLATPGVMSLAGQPLGGWGQYSLSPTMTSWNAHLFYLHWRYTMDDAFLRDEAYPWCREAAECVAALLKTNTQGRLILPRSSSPEIFDNTDRAWLIPNSNYDLMCMKMQFLALAEMADALGLPDEAARWHHTASALGDFHAGPDGCLWVDEKTPLPYSHRHFSNLMGLYPFNLVTSEGSDVDRTRIRASLAQYEALGTSQWCGYSFAWMSCLQARIGNANAALRALDIFVKAFVLRNGFHANGDQTKSGFSSMTYRPFTLEGNFAAMQALQEMLLQSWSPTPGQRDTEVVRLFPATSDAWSDAAFHDLRAEGAFRVSARREHGRTSWFRLVATRNTTLRLRDNFAGRTPAWNRAEVRKTGGNFVCTLREGEVLEATLAD